MLYLNCRCADATKTLNIALAYLWWVITGNDYRADARDDTAGGDSHDKPGPELLIPGFLVVAHCGAR